MRFKEWFESIRNPTEPPDLDKDEDDDDYSHKDLSWGQQRQINPQFGQLAQNKPTKTKDIPKKGFQTIKPPQLKPVRNKFEDEVVRTLRDQVLESGAPQDKIDAFMKQLKRFKLGYIDPKRFASGQTLERIKQMPNNFSNFTDLQALKPYVISGDMDKLAKTYLEVLIDEGLSTLKSNLINLIEDLYEEYHDDYGYYIKSFDFKDLKKEINKISIPLDSIRDLNLIFKSFPEFAQKATSKREKLDLLSQFFYFYLKPGTTLQITDKLKYYIESLIQLFTDGPDDHQSI